MNKLKTAEIAPNIFWVGGGEQHGGLRCNPYLLVDNDEAVLIDPGSVLDFEDVLANVCSIIPLEKIKYVILHHQDPDFCAGVPLFEQKGARFIIAAHWRTQTLVRYYGIKSDYYIVNENEFKLVLKSGRVLSFVQTPYLHFPGSIATYDSHSKILFSSDLFGAFSGEWSLYASDDYMEKMKAFHEHYMPSNDILRPVMEVLLGMDIAMIAPQHGSIINNRISEYIKALRDLECGAFLTPIKHDLAKSGGYKSICSKILKRYASIFKKQEVLEVIEDLEISFENGTLDITDYNYRGNTLWNIIFEQVLAKKGMRWLYVIEPLVNKISQEYDVEIPEVFNTTLKQAEEQVTNLNLQNTWLKEMNLKLSNSIKETQEKLIKCSITDLYNYDFFKNYLTTELKDLFSGDSKQNPGLIIISADNMHKIKFSYGDNEVDEIMRNIVYTINNIKDDNTLLFRLQGFELACYLPHTSRGEAIEFAESIRNAVAASEKFIEKITVSAGVVIFDEINDQQETINEPSESMYKVAMLRVKIAKNRGMNLVCSNSTLDDYREELSKILIIDDDQVNRDVLKTALENLKIKVVTVNDGEEALRITEREAFDLIISEIMIPKVDGFLVREKLLMQSDTKNTPFFFVSHMKNDDSILHAAALGVEHYFKKPFMLTELLAIVKIKLKGKLDSEF
ncbi:MAG: response regulator [Syntrophomonadaceae bacterium]|nr:response regulator [Syntrophomonadaceae bacterium]MDD3022572.1 response regulator [Syntrophomonadaceae bacterium]